ncbi:MAG: nucleotide sugar dehydrogenase [Coriobacteriales bacterium]|jgi:UDP-N-acetyl-D-mannosaminuronic acid dehydrogenase|nr:nucleotide sugar dehydrogenase [Coriobacteriales bacterium]
MENTRVCVIGCGYIGLPTAAVFADKGCDVLAVDINERIVDSINRGEAFFNEPGLSELIEQAVKCGRLKASTAPEPADVFIIAVPTPFKDDALKSCDLSSVLKAIESVLPCLRPGNAVIIESTMAPRSTEDYVVPLIAEAGFVIGSDVFLAHCPERVLPTNIISELVNNDRIIGGYTPACADKAAAFYRIVSKGAIFTTEAKTAEMAKCIENVFRDLNIALANELVIICDELSINCLDVISLANRHPRVNIHAPGPGVGGHCLAIDPYFVSSKAPDKANIIRLARATNESMPGFVTAKAKKLLLEQGLSISHAKVAVLGVAYKGNVDDCRESPALDVISSLQKSGSVVAVFDPRVSEYAVPLESVMQDACIAIVLTDHDEFKEDALQPYVGMMQHPLVFDTRNVVGQLDGAQVVNFGNLFSVAPAELEQAKR